MKSIKAYSIGAAASAILLLLVGFRPEPATESYQWRQFSTIESVVPGGIGRSRIIISDEAGTELEKDLLNFYSLTGINFKNVSNNDRLIVETIDGYSNDGWELHTVVTGVNSAAEGKGGTGIFITRYLFRKPR
mgnify:CR=1 FL=1